MLVLNYFLVCFKQNKQLTTWTDMSLHHLKLKSSMVKQRKMIAMYCTTTSILHYDPNNMWRAPWLYLGTACAVRWISCCKIVLQYFCSPVCCGPSRRRCYRRGPRTWRSWLGWTWNTRVYIWSWVLYLPTYQPTYLPISSSPKLLFIEEHRSSRIMILIKISYIVYFQR